MTRESYYQCTQVRLTTNETYLSSLLDFLVRNQSLIANPTEVASRFKPRGITQPTPISRLYGAAVDLGLDRLFALANVGSSKVNVPLLFQRTHLTIDILQMGALSHSLPKIVEMVPSLKDKIVLNVTQFTRNDWEFTNFQGFQDLVVRDLLSRSFYQDKRPVWLTPNIIQFVCKVYTMSLATSVARWYHLDYTTQQAIAAIFAYYFLNQMSNPVTAKALIKSRWKPMGLPDPMVIDQIIDLAETMYGGPPLELEEVFAMVQKVAPARAVLTRSSFITGLQSLGPDYYTTSIGLQYPPYFLFLILLALSGRKNSLSILLKDTGLIKDSFAVVDELVTSPLFLKAL